LKIENWKLGMGKEQTILFHSTIFGPVHSRRLGISLGVNLMPSDGKICSFDCLYCEAGYNAQGAGKMGLPTVEQVDHDLRATLLTMHENGEHPDVITFSGNGEPTLHPEFDKVVDVVIAARNELCPEAKISVLTNSTRIFDEKVAKALTRVDNNILKLDSAIEETMRLIDRPNDPHFTVERVIEALCRFEGTGIIQTMLLRGRHTGVEVDNTTAREIEALIAAYKRISPREVMLYSIDRSTPEEELQAVSHEELRAIANRLTAAGIPVASF
jgi:wyosine [tRNA(Phe)-imidazoG37] synthetase (radical SAM superfamily)